MFFLAFPILFLSGFSRGFRFHSFSWRSKEIWVESVKKSLPVVFLAYPSEYPTNETLEIEMAKQRMKEKMQQKYYPYSKLYFEKNLKRLNQKRFASGAPDSNGSQDLDQTSPEFLELFQNISYQIYNNSGHFDYEIYIEDGDEDEDYADEGEDGEYGEYADPNIPEIFVVSNQQSYPRSKDPHTRNKSKFYGQFQQFIPKHFPGKEQKKKKSEHFEVLDSSPISFQNIGGYENVKLELMQCIDILRNYTKYQDYNVRTPKGLILEGPPGNGKTLLAKGFAGEANASFIAVSGSEFQEKYVGVGASRVRELFELAKENIPCVIFIDEMDAIGRKRSNDAEASNSERDATLNQLLVNMDGFASTSGIFIVGATNRADLLDPALVRPGRIDKRVFIGLPDAITREAVLEIHIRGKPHDTTINVSNLVEITQGFSGAQLENLLNEAMLLAIRNSKTEFAMSDVENVMNRFLAGWQPTEHKFTGTMLEKIAIHEMGHAIVGLLAKHHSKMTKVVINLSSPQSPGYTVFETSSGGLYTREALFEHLMILLAGRIAEEVFYNVSVTTGAINDFEEALKLAEKMVVYYGMGRNLIYPSLSEKYKERIDSEVVHLIQDAYSIAYFIVSNSKYIIKECADILQKEKILRAETILEMAKEKYPRVLELHS